ncbi:hypothetical protein J4429_05045 [Candidatus Pacearchaeota archaeon]|nr:hypothetical protein [Candidatus Pacearchaeota archaeon]
MIKRGKIINNTKGQEFMGMSFSIMFSIFLIIVFIVIAFIAIKAFLSTQQCAQVGIFKKDFQADVDKAWNSASLSLEFKRSLPSTIEYVCFANFSEILSSNGIEGKIGNDIKVYDETESNMFFYPLENACEMPGNQINHLNIAEITKTKNPYCIKTSKGQIILKIEKPLREVLVRVS